MPNTQYMYSNRDFLRYFICHDITSRTYTNLLMASTRCFGDSEHRLLSARFFYFEIWAFRLYMYLEHHLRVYTTLTSRFKTVLKAPFFSDWHSIAQVSFILLQRFVFGIKRF